MNSIDIIRNVFQITTRIAYSSYGYTAAIQRGLITDVTHNTLSILDDRVSAHVIEVLPSQN